MTVKMDNVNNDIIRDIPTMGDKNEENKNLV